MNLMFHMLSSCILFFYRECLDSDGSPVPRPPKPTHQRSHSKPFSFPSNPSATVSTGSPLDGLQLRNSWSESSVEEAPPLPPRGQSECHVPVLDSVHESRNQCRWLLKPPSHVRCNVSIDTVLFSRLQVRNPVFHK